jgi:hypothetical protein
MEFLIILIKYPVILTMRYNGTLLKMETKLAKLEATETSVEAESDPAINENDVVVNKWDAFAKSILK